LKILASSVEDLDVETKKKMVEKFEKEKQADV
jgi:hypothetical protein